MPSFLYWALYLATIMLSAALLAAYRAPSAKSYLLVRIGSAKPVEMATTFLALPLSMSGRKRLKRWMLAMTLTSNASRSVSVTSSGRSALLCCHSSGQNMGIVREAMGRGD